MKTNDEILSLLNEEWWDMPRRRRTKLIRHEFTTVLNKSGYPVNPFSYRNHICLDSWKRKTISDLLRPTQCHADNAAFSRHFSRIEELMNAWSCPPGSHDFKIVSG